MRRARSGRGLTARFGELAASVWLFLKGYRIVARNWRCKLGELDLVCRRGGVLVFVEVRTRRGTRAGSPEASVDRRKQAQVVRVARAFLARQGRDKAEIRFDVVGIGGGWPPIRHLPGAFVAEPEPRS